MDTGQPYRFIETCHCGNKHSNTDQEKFILHQRIRQYEIMLEARNQTIGKLVEKNKENWPLLYKYYVKKGIIKQENNKMFKKIQEWWDGLFVKPADLTEIYQMANEKVSATREECKAKSEEILGLVKPKPAKKKRAVKKSPAKKKSAPNKRGKK